MQDASIHFERD